MPAPAILRTVMTLAMVAFACAQVNAGEALIPGWARDAAIQLCTAAGTAPRPDHDAVAAMTGAAPDSVAILTDDDTAFAAAILRDGQEVEISIVSPGTPQSRTQLLSLSAQAAGAPSRQLYMLQANAACVFELGRAVQYDENRVPVSLHHYGAELVQGDVEQLNPDVPSGMDPGGVAVAHVDTGVAYTLPHIAARLARSEGGGLLGADLADDDGKPFDLDPQSGPLFPRRHGTAVASILLQEAPDARLIEYRYPGSDWPRFGTLVTMIAAGPARIVAMPLGSNRKSHWDAFAQAARQHDELLFIVSAGNDGVDIDHAPVYPATLDLDNFLVVTSVDAFGRLANRSNWGPASVDIAVPAEDLPVIDHRGAQVTASGSSYAVPRVAAFAARLLAMHPDWTAQQLRSAIIAQAHPLPRGQAGLIRHGWLADPSRAPVD